MNFNRSNSVPSPKVIRVPTSDMENYKRRVSMATNTATPPGLSNFLWYNYYGQRNSALKRYRRPLNFVSQTVKHSELLRLIEALKDANSIGAMIKINEFIAYVIKCELCFILIEGKEKNCIVVSVAGKQVLEKEIKIRINRSTFQEAMLKKRTLYTKDVSSDHLKILNYITGLQVESFICVPITHPEKDKVEYLVCGINKRHRKIGYERALFSNKSAIEVPISEFQKEDEEIINDIFTYTKVILYRNLLYEEETDRREKCQNLLKIAHKFLTNIDDHDKLLHGVLIEAKRLINAERCSLFIVDKPRKQLVAQVFEGAHIKNQEIRIPLNMGIVGHVALTGKLLNIPDAYANPLFYKELDKINKFKTKNILCFPIRTKGVTIAVAQLCNKKHGQFFTPDDEELASSFGVYCAITIEQSMMWKKIRETQYRNQLSNDLVMYHMLDDFNEVNSLVEAKIMSPQAIHPNYSKFIFNPRDVETADTLKACMAMYNDLNFIAKWKIPLQNLAKFVTMVKKGYRNPAYHNWNHGFSVGHFAYLCVKNFKLQDNYLTPLECLTLVSAAFCHDLDHRGTTNSFQVSSGSDLAALYSSEGSVMERHHFTQTIAILNREGCNIFESLNQTDYIKALDLVRDIILATDLARHFGHIGHFKEMISEGFNKDNPYHHELLLCLLITSCDLSDQTKSWKAIKNVAKLIYTEFFSQGDLERNMGHKPIEMMDREKACIPNQQIGFIRGVIAPLFTFVHALFPQASLIMKVINNNIAIWTEMKDIFENEEYQKSDNPLIILDDEAIDERIDAFIIRNNLEQY